MNAHRQMISLSLSIFLLLGTVSTVSCIDNADKQDGVKSVSLASPLTSGDCVDYLQDRTVDLHHIATEHAQMPSNWCVEKGRPSNEVSFSQPYDVVKFGKTDWRSIYQIRMTLDDENHVESVAFYKNSLPVQSIPRGLWDIALRKLDTK